MAMIRDYIVLAALFGLTGVALGAFASHGLRSQLSAAHLAVFQTGVQYQLILPWRCSESRCSRCNAPVAC